MKGLKERYYLTLLLSINRGMAYGRHSNAKPIFMLSIMWAVENGEIIGNKIMYDEKLEGIYKKMCNQYEPNIKAALFYKPFYHSSRESFYTLVWQDGKMPMKGCHTPSAKFLRENVSYACLDPELWDLLQDPQTRDEFRKAIISHYLKPDKEK